MTCYYRLDYASEHLSSVFSPGNRVNHISISAKKLEGSRRVVLCRAWSDIAINHEKMFAEFYHESVVVLRGLLT